MAINQFTRYQALRRIFGPVRSYRLTFGRRA